MSVRDITPAIARLENQLDRVEDDLEPLIANLATLASQLPLLDKAKLFALTAYSIHALLHSAVRIQGMDAQAHPVTAELKRVQRCFASIRTAEAGPEPPAGQRPNVTVNTEAVARVLKHDLGSYDADLKRRLEEQISQERALALLNSIGRRSRKRAADDAQRQATPAAPLDDGRSRKKKHKTQR